MKNENEMYERYIDELNKYLKTIDFKKGIERRKDLYVSGYNSVRRYLQSLQKK